jgi:hypothetical protein
MVGIHEFKQNVKKYSVEVYKVAARTSLGHSKNVHWNDLLQKIHSCDEKKREKYCGEE